MKINQKMLSIPPHISTSWKNVQSLHLAKDPQNPNAQILVITLNNDSIINVPNLDEDTLKSIFEAHLAFVENQDNCCPSEVSEGQKNQKPANSAPSNPFGLGAENTLTFGFPFKLGDMDPTESMGTLGNMMQHNQEQANAPNLPENVLSKITTVAKSIGLEKQFEQMPKAEPHCNCPYCQLARAFHGQAPKEQVQEDLEEEVSDEDLKFRDWDIKSIGENLYQVTNPLDETEHYQVFLGSPVGCTCGNKNCEHIKAVLNS